MTENVIYICINMHGSLYPTSSSDPTPIKLRNPTFMNVQKFSITFPGTTGLNDSPEFVRAKELIQREEFITPKRMETELLKTYYNSMESRRKDDLSIKKKSDPKQHISDISRYSIPCQEYMEPQQGVFFFKSYEIDQDYDADLFSIYVLNGPFAGTNILDYNFLSRYYPSILGADPNDLFTFPNGLRVLKEIELSELLYLLYSIGITNVFIIDPSCSNNIDAKNLRDERRMKRVTIQEYGNKPSGTIITMDQPPTNNVCKKCNTSTATAAAAATGIACCLGSMGASAPLTATAAVVAASLGAYSGPKIVKMIKREGGKKNRRTKRCKKYYKNKTKKYYKFKKNYKTKKHKNPKYYK